MTYVLTDCITWYWRQVRTGDIDGPRPNSVATQVVQASAETTLRQSSAHDGSEYRCSPDDVPPDPGPGRDRGLFDWLAASDNASDAPAGTVMTSVPTRSPTTRPRCRSKRSRPRNMPPMSAPTPYVDTAVGELRHAVIRVLRTSATGSDRPGERRYPQDPGLPCLRWRPFLGGECRRPIGTWRLYLQYANPCRSVFGGRYQPMASIFRCRSVCVGLMPTGCIRGLTWTRRPPQEPADAGAAAARTGGPRALVWREAASAA
jgi:hypothetical protein